MCCVFQYKLAVKFTSEAEPQLFLACPQFLGKFEPRCSYQIVVIKKSVYAMSLVILHANTEVLDCVNCKFDR